MKIPGITRDIIHIIKYYSNWDTKNMDTVLKENIYADKNDWIKFLNYSLLGIGAAFSISGIIFFFAFNWDNVPNFFKMGLVEVLIIGCIACVLFTDISQLVKQIILSSAALLVGALFAVFGQVYQTGADAYDFFLAWTVFIILWTFAANFPPLWLIFLSLLNTTIWLYFQQVVDWQDMTVLFAILFSINALFVFIFESLYHTKLLKKRSTWLIYTVVLAIIIMVTINIIFFIFEPGVVAGLYSFFVCLLGFSGGLYYGYKSKNIFYIGTIAAAIITIISSLLVRGMIGDEITMFFIISIFIISSITFLIKMIIYLNKKWNGIN